VDLPPLRERPEDIEELAGHFLSRCGLESGSEPKRLSASAVAMLCRYDWPGNVRELENVVRSVALFADAPTIDVRDFDEYRELFEDAPAFARAASASVGPVRSEAPAPAAPPGEPPSRLYALPPPPPPAPAAPVPGGEPEAAMLDKIFAQGIPLAELKKKLQEEAIAQALKMSKGNITRAAEMLGMKRPRLSQIINASAELRELCQGVGR
jgi:sigma-54 specific flagellar transcriptional regulator A